MCWACSMHDD